MERARKAALILRCHPGFAAREDRDPYASAVGACPESVVFLGPGQPLRAFRDDTEDSGVTAAERDAKEIGMILAASQQYFWYFGYPTPLAPAEDRSA